MAQIPAPNKPAKKPGPPKGQLYKATPAVLEKLQQAFAIDATIEEACFYADINPATYYLWKKAKPEQFEKLERLRNTPILAARQAVVSSFTGLTPDVQMALKYLERKRKKEFGTNVDITSDGKPIQQPAILSPITARDAQPQTETTESG